MEPSSKLGCHQTYQTNLLIIILRVIKSHQIATFAASLAFFRFLRRTRSAASLKRKGSAAVRSLQALEASVEEGSTSESWLNLGPMSWEKWRQFKKALSLFSYTIRVQNSYRYGWYGDLHRPVHCKIRSHLSQLSKNIIVLGLVIHPFECTVHCVGILPVTIMSDYQDYQCVVMQSAQTWLHFSMSSSIRRRANSQTPKENPLSHVKSVLLPCFQMFPAKCFRLRWGTVLRPPLRLKQGSDRVII